MGTETQAYTREIFDNIPQMPIRERDRRWKAIRELMDTEGIDVILVVGNDMQWSLGMANFRYFSNIAARHGGFLIFPKDGEPIVFSMPIHMTWPVHPYKISQDWVSDVRDNIQIDGVLKIIQETVFPLKKLGIVYGANTINNFNLPHNVFAALTDTLKGVEIVNASPFIVDMRRVKSEDELTFLRAAGKIHYKVLQAKIDTAQAGVTEADVYAEMISTMIKNGGEAEIFNLLLSGPIAAPEMQHLLHGLDQNISPTMRTLKKGDIIVSETHIIYGGYMTAAEFTVAIGEPPDWYKRIYEAAIECLHIILENAKPGAKMGDVISLEKEIVAKHKLSWLELGMHGHGLGSPEIPEAVYMGMNPDTWRVSKAQEEVVLQENMVVGTNIDLYDSAFRKDVGIMFGDTVLIKDKPEMFVNTPQQLPVK
jgi:Xaa-Pro aminopeptidase